MSNNFTHPEYYNLIYKDKNYKDEANFIDNAIRAHLGKKTASILSMGCGTGNYEFLLIDKGYKITGIDLSPEMVALAKIEMLRRNKKFDIHIGDVKTIKIPKKFDICLAMFNIVGYQNTNQEFNQFIKNAYHHLKKGGLLIFDGWYLPAVLKDRPMDKIKKIDLKNGREIIRYTTQKINIEKSLLNIKFKIEDRQNNKIKKTIKEEHNLRFFSFNEINFFLELNHFKLLKMGHFPKLNQKLTENNWNFFTISKKI